MADVLNKLGALPASELQQVEAHRNDEGVDVKRFQVMLHAVDMKKAGNAQDWQLRDIYREMQSASVPDDQQQEVATFVGAFGLFTPKAIAAYAKDLAAVFAGWHDLATAEQRAEVFGDLVNRRLVQAGVPAVEVKVGGTESGGEFDHEKWKLLVSPRLGRLDLKPEEQSDFIQRAAATFYHEARHAEQSFTIARTLAGKGRKPAQVAAELHIPGDIAAKADAAKLAPGSPEALAAEPWFQSEYGSGQQHREDVLNNLKNSHDAYKALPEEADAHALGVAVTDKIRGGAQVGTPDRGDAGTPGGVQRAIAPETRSMSTPAPARRGPAPIVQRDSNADATLAAKLESAAIDLYGYLVANSPNVEKVLYGILLQKDNLSKLRETYDKKFKRSLWDDLTALHGDDVIRARCYLKFGQLRPADKIYIAIHGVLTDETTVMRVIKTISADRAPSEKEFRETYGDPPDSDRIATSVTYKEDDTLPNGESSRITKAIMDETPGAKFSDRFKMRAVLAFGTPRAADDVKIATVDPTNNADLLFDALQREDAKKISTDFAASYNEPLKDYLSKETSLHTKARALMLIDENVKPEDRLVETIRIGTSGYTTADADFIFDAAQHATSDQITAFKRAVGPPRDARLKDMDATFGGMNKEQLDRLNALVGIGDDAGILGDPTVKRLRAEGGNSSGAAFEVLKNSTGPAYDAYKNAYQDGKSSFRRYVDQFCDASEKGWLASYVFTDFRSRLNFVMTNPGYDDYIMFLLNSFADSGVRRQLATDSDFGAKVENLSTATKNKILLVLQPANMTPQERAVWLDAAVKRETASGVGSLTAASSALQDENRELQAAKERAGKNPTPQQQAEIDRLASQTDDALTAFVHYRDELEATVSTAVDIGVGLLLTVATGGVAAETILLALARAAIASALAKVVTHKIVMGDRFDVMGADGASAFVTGAVDGMLNVVGPAVGKGVKGLAGVGLEESAAVAAKAAAPGVFRQFAATTGSKMAEGAVTGGLSSAVDTMAQDKTWSDGFDRGMRKTLVAAGAGAATGAATGALPPALGALVGVAGGLEALNAAIDVLPDADVTLERVAMTPPLSPSVSTLRASVPVQRADNFGKAFESYVDGKLWTDGLDGAVPPMHFVMPGAYNNLDNGIDRIGVIIDGDKITVYHFEMKWRNPAVEGQPKPAVELGRPPAGTQTGGSWTENAVHNLCESDHKTALAARDAARAMLAKARGKSIDAITMEEVKEFIRSTVTARRVVVVPLHVDVRRLMKQVAALASHGVKIDLVRTKVPK
jgi:hypothetical protein